MSDLRQELLAKPLPGRRVLRIPGRAARMNRVKPVGLAEYGAPYGPSVFRSARSICLNLTSVSANALVTHGRHSWFAPRECGFYCAARKPGTTSKVQRNGPRPGKRREIFHRL